MKWYVIRTKPNFEIKVADALNSLGINAYCPVFSFIKQYSDRKKKVEKPLLPSYVLVFIEESNRVKVFSVPGVIRYMFYMGKPAIVRDEEIEILKSELSNFYNISNSDKLNKGSGFKIPKGPFKGIEGEIVNLTKNKLRLKLKTLGLFMTVSLG
tara:strand:- start:955 stop:1416 length:462 start_codon:yes stop_codon:yes gene_type:complete